ncbi:MAG: Ribosomal large subunit pseudouridine synthase D [uncultured Acidimicrobiales bacterium]|uniref:Pseudouridine synthase n=1 Tax=uncultured Acidimicrobiales bacterium TaxID=310071 RepID=A0A6J4J3Y0_9ACTN|nr:MAG: Ribosomal large subunit pseudouridine synthase D [uncultured Acidimicrobiales bacterium]
MIEAIPPALDGERVDRVVSLVTGLPRGEAAELVDRGDVQINGSTVTNRSKKLRSGERLEILVPVATGPMRPAADPSVPVPVVHVDDDIVVVDKPAGLVVHPGAGNDTGTLVNGLLAQFPDLAGTGQPERPGIVHRLDAGTSGLLVVARTAEAHTLLVAQMAARTVERVYLALVLGTVEPDNGVVDAPIGRSGRDPTRMAVVASGREARTRYTVLTRRLHPVATTEVECRLETGRTHQIRVHLAAIGHPVVGDTRYGGERPAVPLARPYLHAHRLSFDHPATGERVTFSSPLPADLVDQRAQLS